MAVRPNTLKSRKWPALTLAVITLALLAYVIWRVDTSPGTDDAYAQADTIDVVPDVSGRIVEMAVKDNQRVNKGDLLFRVDPRPFEDELARAKASLVALDKQIALTRRVVTAQQYGADSVHALVERARVTAAQTAETLRRTQPLLAPGYVSAEDVDRVRTAQRAAEADLVAARLQAQQATSAVTGVDALVAQRDVVLADIALMQFRLDMTTVRAPFDGRVVSLKTSVGQFASALKPIFTLIDTRHWYVVANFRETELKNIRPGTPATVYLMSDTGKRFKGKVDSIGYGVLPDDGGLVLGGLPRVQRSINWVRVAQRFPVKILVDQPDAELFRIGASAVAQLNPQLNPLAADKPRS
ncbi:membrane fusion protein, multidrug efflux system [Paraburkholderia steynii]|uniref:Membrane fusion protein, multidrug efflux system n=1 Tax=Paraburkholderia steynii TaxID=1245441 RepID=A0A7Z7B4Y4_9BURK|nr:multidrug transporter subunit MdtN [Paraburkholderia steynii]SDH64090.1 membrane fusion protein, multidrug efflux system [Paraburkholderia steynii]